MRTIDLDNRRRVVVLGEGQVGSAVTRSLLRSPSSVSHQSRTDWATPETAARTTAQALEALRPIGDQGGRTTVVWSAGTAGMTTSKERCEQNLETMKATIAAALESVHSDQTRSLHIIASAGSYAHNSRRWPSGDSEISPEIEIPYIWLKLAEEEWARTQLVGPAAADVTIHRVASVYARPGDPGRSGMVAAMVRNASRGNVTSIFGKWSTIRNYVHADDVGEFVARSARNDTAGSAARITETLLADRRSYSIAELVQLVSRAIRRPVPLRIIATENAHNHTFNPGLIADGFAARPLATAIRQMFVDLQT